MQLLHLLFPRFDGVQVSIKANDGRICVNRYFFAGTFRYIKIYYLNTHAVLSCDTYLRWCTVDDGSSCGSRCLQHLARTHLIFSVQAIESSTCRFCLYV